MMVYNPEDLEGETPARGGTLARYSFLGKTKFEFIERQRRYASIRLFER
jgi:hypothetical protein